MKGFVVLAILGVALAFAGMCRVLQQQRLQQPSEQHSDGLCTVPTCDSLSGPTYDCLHVSVPLVSGHAYTFTVSSTCSTPLACAQDLNDIELNFNTPVGCPWSKVTASYTWQGTTIPIPNPTFAGSSSDIQSHTDVQVLKLTNLGIPFSSIIAGSVTFALDLGPVLGPHSCTAISPLLNTTTSAAPFTISLLLSDDMCCARCTFPPASPSSLPLLPSPRPPSPSSPTLLPLSSSGALPPSPEPSSQINITFYYAVYRESDAGLAGPPLPSLHDCHSLLSPYLSGLFPRFTQEFKCCDNSNCPLGDPDVTCIGAYAQGNTSLVTLCQNVVTQEHFENISNVVARGNYSCGWEGLVVAGDCVKQFTKGRCFGGASPPSTPPVPPPLPAPSSGPATPLDPSLSGAIPPGPVPGDKAQIEITFYYTVPYPSPNPNGAYPPSYEDCLLLARHLNDTYSRGNFPLNFKCCYHSNVTYGDVPATRVGACAVGNTSLVTLCVLDVNQEQFDDIFKFMAPGMVACNQNGLVVAGDCIKSFQSTQCSHGAPPPLTPPPSPEGPSPSLEHAPASSPVTLPAPPSQCNITVNYTVTDSNNPGVPSMPDEHVCNYLAELMTKLTTSAFECCQNPIRTPSNSPPGSPEGRRVGVCGSNNSLIFWCNTVSHETLMGLMSKLAGTDDPCNVAIHVASNSCACDNLVKSRDCFASYTPPSPTPLPPSP